MSDNNINPNPLPQSGKIIDEANYKIRAPRQSGLCCCWPGR